jgi:hypothetical protein
MRMARVWSSASLVVALLIPTAGGVLAVAQDEPVLHMPFDCGSLHAPSTKSLTPVPWAAEPTPPQRSGIR